MQTISKQILSYQFSGLDEPVEKVILRHPALQEELEKSTTGPSYRRHLLQNASLVAHLQQVGAISARESLAAAPAGGSQNLSSADETGNTEAAGGSDSACFLEFGAGRG